MNDVTSSRDEFEEAGLSLIELIVYILLISILLAGIAVIFINTWKAQASVTSQTAATNRGQLVGAEIEKAVRNATGIYVSSDGSTLEVLTDFTGSRQCQGFAMTASGLQMTVEASPASAPTAWPVWQSRVQASGTVPVFQQVGANGVSGIQYTFDATSDSAPVHITGTTYARETVSGVVSPCW